MSELVLHPSAQLRLVSEEVTHFGDELGLLAQHMRSVMASNYGIGLAAPQIGILERIVLVGKFTMVNPRIIWLSDATSEMNEGCLSIPGTRVSVRRPSAVEVEFFDIQGSKKSLRLHDMMAKVVQHEIDHLNGRLIIDYETQFEMVP